MPIRFVYFDVGGVVLHFADGLSKLAQMYNKSLFEIQKIFNLHDDAICRGELSTEDLWQIYQTKLGIGDSNLVFSDYWVSNFKPIEPIHTLMSSLVQSDVKVGLLTNIYPGIYEKAIKRRVIPNLQYHSVIQSCEIGVCKPEPEIYKHAQQRTGLKPEEILFIDDKIEFLEPAVDLGWKTVRFDQNDIHESIKQIHSVISSLSVR